MSVECDCYAKFAKTEAEKNDHHPHCRVALRKAGLAAERRRLLDWAESHPGVLSLLEALRAADYDETGTECLRRVVAGTGAKGERRPDWRELAEAAVRADGGESILTASSRCANCGESFSAGKHVPRGKGCCEVPV